MSAKQARIGKMLARKLPPPKITEVKGVKVVTQQVEGLSAEELLCLSEYYRQKHGS